MGKYFFRYRNPAYLHATLVELTREEYRDEVQKAGAGGYPRYVPVSAQKAHNWVKTGGHHETALYTDCDGRIRYAVDGC